MYIEVFSTGEDVCRGIIVFRPSMYGYVGLRDCDNTCDSHWVEFVESFSYDLCPGIFSSLGQQILNTFKIIQFVSVTFLQIQKQMYSKNLQLIGLYYCDWIGKRARIIILGLYSRTAMRIFVNLLTVGGRSNMLF